VSKLLAKRAEELFQPIFRQIVSCGNDFFARVSSQGIGALADSGENGTAVRRKNESAVITVTLDPCLDHDAPMLTCFRYSSEWARLHVCLPNAQPHVCGQGTCPAQKD
jgi:hypothetical protein